MGTRLGEEEGEIVGIDECEPGKDVDGTKEVIADGRTDSELGLVDGILDAIKNGKLDGDFVMETLGEEE